MSEPTISLAAALKVLGGMLGGGALTKLLSVRREKQRDVGEQQRGFIADLLGRLDTVEAAQRAALEAQKALLAEVAELRGRLDTANARITHLERENAALNAENALLTEARAEIARLDDENVALRAENAALVAENHDLRESASEAECLQGFGPS